MVGCGALGCEFLKNFALNGVCCGPDGLLTVTDADRIELSNLTRQFLFREHNVGQPKSKAATAMAQIMNPGMKVRALEMFVGPKTEDTFNDDFWLGLDGICNALDNMEARFYVDDQCVKYERPLLESGTMGPAGNVDPVVPFKTHTYRDGGQADEGGGIPMCTLRNFPHLPDHCIEWARDQFELFFVKSVKQLKKFNEDPGTFIGDISSSTDVTQSIFEVRGLLSLLNAAASPSIESAGQTAFGAFPQSTAFDVEKETHRRFLVRLLSVRAASTALFAAMLGAVPQKQEGDATASGVTAGVKADSKDDDFNYHIDFITQCANLRADNYHITNSDFHKVKLVAGRIVPAIATTTASVCGLVMLELFKLLQGKKTEGFRTRQIGLAMNTYTSFEAQEPRSFSSGVEKKVPRAEDLPPEAFDDAGKIKAEYVIEEAYASYPEKHSVWDKIHAPELELCFGLEESCGRGWVQAETTLRIQENKEMKVPFSSQIFPPPVSIDAKLLPPLTDGQADAMKKIMASAAIPQAQKMKYVGEWQKAKQSGKLPNNSSQEISDGLQPT
ncbi:unnamed protein product [Durusdinium trenchii]|uniref:Ubiquitin-activating enzyme E1 n=1 Tax=Durusdinium trenchii TaxID=1381693 RepID=A0ABP0L5W3_9DINO